MAAFRLTDVSRFPTGTTVNVYSAAGARFGQAPSGSVVATGVMGTLAVTFVGLDDAADYVAYALVSGQHRYSRFQARPDHEVVFSDRGRIETLETLVDFRTTVSVEEFGDIDTIDHTELFNLALGSGLAVTVPYRTAGYSITGKLVDTTPGSALVGVGHVAPTINIGSQVAVEFSGAGSRIENVKFVGTHESSAYQFKLAATATHNVFRFEAENIGSGVDVRGSFNTVEVRFAQVRGSGCKMVDDATGNRVWAEIQNGVGFGVYTDDGAYDNWIEYVHKFCDPTAFTQYMLDNRDETDDGRIGIEAAACTVDSGPNRWGTIRADRSGDAGMTLTGSDQMVDSIFASDCAGGAIGFLGSRNTVGFVFARGCAKGAGFTPAAGAQSNDNTLVSIVALDNETYGVEHEAVVYRQWISGLNIPPPTAFVAYLGNVYRVFPAGTHVQQFGTVAPVHTTPGQVVSDGVVDLEFMGTEDDASGNRVLQYNGSGNGTAELVNTSEFPVEINGVQFADGTLAGGAARGVNAVDWQVVRAFASHVASGEASVIGGGNSNQASGSESSVLGGNSNQATGTRSAILGGVLNDASGSNSSVVGGEGNLADGTYSQASGRYASTRGMYGVWARASGRFSVVGDSQARRAQMRVSTTNATPSVISADGLTAATANQMTIPDGTFMMVEASVAAREAATGDCKWWTVKCAIKRGTGVATAALVGSATSTAEGASAGASAWTVAATADTSRGGLTLTVTGEAAKTIHWVAQVRTVEVG